LESQLFALFAGYPVKLRSLTETALAAGILGVGALALSFALPHQLLTYPAILLLLHLSKPYCSYATMSELSFTFSMMIQLTRS